jgi:hypothetical protein
MPSIEALKREIERLAASLPPEDLEPWPPVEGEGDNLAWALWSGAGFPLLPETRPAEGPFLYLLHLAASKVWR